MSNWWQRMLGRGEESAPVAPLSGSEAPSPPPVAAAPARSPALVLRRALLESSGAVAGFELVPAWLAAQRLAAGNDTQAAAHLVALLAAVRPSPADAEAPRPRLSLLAMPARLLTRSTVLDALHAGLWLALPADEFTPDVAQALLSRQVLAGVEGVPQRGAAFVRIDAAAVATPKALSEVIGTCRAAAATTRIVVTGLDSAEGIEAALAAGADLAGGSHDVALHTNAALTMPAAMLTVARLMQSLRNDADLAAIAPALRADVALSYSLLRHVNSPLLGLRRKIDSVEQAVMILGRAPLYRWLCLRLLAAAPPRRATRALLEMALARAGFAEALAPRATLDAGRAYTAGLLSLLDVMLATPMATAVAPLNLGDELSAALVQRQGALAAPLLLVASLERGDAARASALAELFGGLETVLPMYDQALAEAALAVESAAAA